MKKNINQIKDFFALKSFALIGASSQKKKFGNEILKQLLIRGINVMPIHKTADLIEGAKCFKTLKSLPAKPEGVILVIPPSEVEKVVVDINEIGIKNVWMQQGAESNKAIEYCVSNGIKVVSKNCMLMFLEKPGFFHGFHRFIWGLGH